LRASRRMATQGAEQHPSRLAALAPQDDGAVVSDSEFQTTGHASAFPMRVSTRVHRKNDVPQYKRGRRECRVSSSPVVRAKNARGSRHRFHRFQPAFPAQWFTAYFVLSPVTGLFCHRCLRTHRKRDASVGASGPHDFAVHEDFARLAKPTSPPHPCPTSVTIAIRPSCGHGMASYADDLRLKASE
jgi:hypothetical protein